MSHTVAISINNSAFKTRAVREKFLDLGRASRRLAQQLASPGPVDPKPERSYRAVLEEAQTLLKSQNPYLVAIGELGQRVKKRLDACVPSRPCRVVGCPRCSQKRVAERTAELCEQAQEFLDRGGSVMLVAVGIGSDSWCGNFESRKLIFDRDMKVLQTKILPRLRILAGWDLHLDAAPMQGDEQMQASGRDGVITREESAWQLHIHGTLAVRGWGDERIATLKCQLDELAGLCELPIRFNLEQVKNVQPPQNPAGDSQPLVRANFDRRSLVGYSLYSRKIVTGSPLGAEATRLLQRHLIGQRLEWTGGVLARQSGPLKPLAQARSLQNWLGSAAELMENLLAHSGPLEMSLTGLGLYERSLKDIRRGLDLVASLQKELVRQRETLVRQKRRCQERIAELRSKYTGNLLREELEKFRRRSRQGRARQQEAAERRQQNILWHWDALKDIFERVFRRSVRVTTELDPVKLSQHALAAELSGDCRGRLERLLSYVASCGMLYSARQSIRQLVRSADRLPESESDTIQAMLDRSVALSQRLESWNSLWPSWLEGETIRALDWRAWWDAWLDRLWRAAVHF